MLEANNAASIQNNLKFRNASWNYRIIFLTFIGFVILLPFNVYEWDLFSIGRFEIKPTMLIFSLLFVAWLGNSFEFPRKRSGKEKLFYAFAFMYGVSQFASLVNSPMPVASIVHGIIIISLLTIMVVISETVLDKKIARFILTSMGILSLIIGIGGVINYYLFAKYFTLTTHRLGAYGALGIIPMGGDAVYFGDILLYSSGAVFFVMLKLSRKKYWGWLSWPLLMLWFSAMVLTYTKGLYGAVICFFLCLILVLKKKRAFVGISIIVFIIAAILNIQGPQYYCSIKPKIEKKIFAAKRDTVPELQKEISQMKVAAVPELQEKLSQIDDVELRSEAEKKAKEKAKRNHYIRERKINLARLSPITPLGRNSIAIRLKAVFISLKNSIEHFWFGNGAGLSQSLLREMANQFDESVDEKTRKFMIKMFIYGPDANLGLIGAHNLFLVTFFEVGIVGVIPLMCLVFFVIRDELRTIKASPGKDDNINELLFATLIAMLFYRITETLLVIPFFWFMLGLCFGVSKLYRNSAHTFRGAG